MARQDALAKSAKAEKLFPPEEKEIIEKLFIELQKVYPNSEKTYKTYRPGRGKGNEFATLSVKGYHKGDRLSAEADQFDQKMKDLGAMKQSDTIKKSIVWKLPRF